MANRELKQSTAATIVVGPFLDVTDPSTALTSLTITQADVQLSKNGGAFAQKNESSSATHLGDGYYSVALNTTDSGTLGHILAQITMTGAFPVDKELAVITANEWDRKYADDKVSLSQPVYEGTIDTYTRNDSFTITSTGAPTTNDVLNGCMCVVIDQSTSTLWYSGTIEDYTASTYTVQLDSESSVFTAEAGDIIRIYRPQAANLVRWRDATPLDTQSGYLQTDVRRISQDAAAADNLEAMFDGTGYSNANAPATQGVVGSPSDLGSGTTIADNLADMAGPTFNSSDDPLEKISTIVSSLTAVGSNQATIITRMGTPSDLGGGATLSANLSDMAGASFDTATDGLDSIRSKTDDIETGTANLQTRVPAALTNGAIDANLTRINDDANAAARLALSAAQMIPGTAVSGTLTITQMTTDLAETTADHYNGRLILFTSGNLAGQVSTVEDYATNGTITMSAVTEAPSNNDTFLLV